MNPTDPSELTDQELLSEIQKVKASTIVNAVLIGVTVGVAIYSTLKNGWGILTFFPLFFGPMILKSTKRKNSLQQELNKRNLRTDQP